MIFDIALSFSPMGARVALSQSVQLAGDGRKDQLQEGQAQNLCGGPAGLRLAQRHFAFGATAHDSSSSTVVSQLDAVSLTTDNCVWHPCMLEHVLHSLGKLRPLGFRWRCCRGISEWGDVGAAWI